MSFRLVTYGPEHVEDVQALLRDPVVQEHVPVPLPLPEDQAQRWLARYTAGRAEGTGAAWVVVDPDGTFVGWACAPTVDVAKGEGELGYMVPAAARGRGVATAALKMVTDWAFGEVGLQRVVLRISAANAASLQVADRAGYAREGLLRSVWFREGTRLDTVLLSRLRSDP